MQRLPAMPLMACELFLQLFADFYQNRWRGEGLHLTKNIIYRIN